MADACLIQRSPLGSLAGNARQLSGAHVTLTELPFLRLTHIVCKGVAGEELLSAGLADRFLVQTGPRPSQFWLGPGEWLRVAEGSSADEKLALHGASFIGVDVSHGRAIFELTGPRADLVLAKGCGLDLHSNVFSDGSYAQTRLAHAAVILHRRGNGFEIHCTADAANYLWDWMSAAMFEFLG